MYEARSDRLVFLPVTSSPVCHSLTVERDRAENNNQLTPMVNGQFIS